MGLDVIAFRILGDQRRMDVEHIARSTVLIILVATGDRGMPYRDVIIIVFIILIYLHEFIKIENHKRKSIDLIVWRRKNSIRKKFERFEDVKLEK